MVSMRTAFSLAPWKTRPKREPISMRQKRYVQSTQPSTTLALFISAPIAGFRAPQAREYLESFPCPPPATVYAPRLSFTNLTTGNAGLIRANSDQWRIAITGGKPNTAVFVIGSKNGGSSATQQLGTTDAQGNFSLNGSSAIGDAGTWSESFKVGTDVAGSLNFSITAPASTGTPPATPPRREPPTSSPAAGSSSTDDGGAAGPFSSAGTSTSSQLVQAAENLPWYAWAVGFGVLYLVFKGGRR